MQSHSTTDAFIIGKFTDDYDINYSISDSTWIQYPDFKLDIIKMDSTEMFVIGYNAMDSSYTKIDYMKFQNQGEYTWGYCYTTYGQKDQKFAESVNSAIRNTPKTGCNGFPFSRMKLVDGY